MKRIMIMIFAAMILIFASISVASEWSVPVVTEPGDAVLTVVVMLPDNGAHPFILDTGAGYTIIGKTTFDTKIRHLDGVSFVRTVHGMSASGTKLTVDVYLIPYLEFSRQCRVENVLVGVIPENELNLIGMNLFYAISPVILDVDREILSGSKCD